MVNEMQKSTRKHTQADLMADLLGNENGVSGYELQIPTSGSLSLRRRCDAFPRYTTCAVAYHYRTLLRFESIKW